MKRKTAILVFLIVGAAAVAVWQFAGRRQPTEVTVARVAVSEIDSPFTAEGIVKGESVEVEPETSGRVTQVLVKEGDRVDMGQKLVELSSSELDRAVDQARAAVATTSQRVEQSQHAYSLTRKQVQSRIDEARAGQRVAKARLDALLAGPRQEEIVQAEQRVRQLESAEAQAKTEYERAKRLYEEGALPLADYQRATTAHNAAKSETQIAREALAMKRSGATAEEKASARAEVASAQAAVDTALAGKEQVDVSEHEFAAAKSAHEQSRSILATAEAARSKATITAPFKGTVSYIPVKVGDLASPGRSLLTLVGEGALTVEAEVGDQDFSKVSVGQEVEVTSAAYPGKKFEGTVSRVAQEAVQKPGTLLRTRVLRAAITLKSNGKAFKPGMEVDVHGRGTVATRAITIPSSALMTSGEEQSVWVVLDGKVWRRSIKVGAYTFELTQVTEGLKEGESVVVSPPESLTEGQAVKVKWA